MKNLEQLGVMELARGEMVLIEGGSRIKVLRRIVEALGIADALNDFGNGFVEGYKETRN